MLNVGDASAKQTVGASSTFFVFSFPTGRFSVITATPIRELLKPASATSALP
jgi:hypothetical protein